MNGQTSAKQKNGSVELLRFVFTSIVIFFHINLDLWDQKKVVAVIRDVPVTFFSHGNIGVEFFFIVTGWLIAKTIYSRYI
jgi:peptidoglycan/LPS O-acetylase OafA/YrhL